tara:strand:+ start:4326 stop:4985 length:660 start_codon:yes stop_codon:yes gene_type:complete
LAYKIWSLIFIFSLSCSHSDNRKFHDYKEGDLLFQDLDSSPICDAIELVTPGYNDFNISHIGVIVNDDNELKVLEAIPNSVQLTKIDSFLLRSLDSNNQPKVMIGRLKNQYKKHIPQAINFMKEKIGDKYDNEFIINNNMYYCSELIYEAFEKSNVFELKPMTFIHPKTNDTLEIWKNYYKKLNIKIPEGKLGINPGIMSTSNKINIIHEFGVFSKSKN